MAQWLTAFTDHAKNLSLVSSTLLGCSQTLITLAPGDLSPCSGLL